MSRLSSKETSRLHRRLTLAAAPRRNDFAVQAVLTLVLAMVIVGQMWLLSAIIDRVLMAGASWDAVAPLAWALLALIAVRALIKWVGEVLAQRVAIWMKTHLRDQLMARILALSPAFAGRERAGELVFTAMDGVEKLDAYYARFIPQGIQMAIIPLVILGFVFWLDPLSGLVLLITGPLIPVFMYLIGTWAEQRTREQWTAMSRMSAHFLDVLQGLTTLKVFGRSRAQVATIETVSDGFRTSTMKVLRVAFLSSMVLELVASISIALVAAEVGVRLIEGMMPFGVGLLVLLLAPEYYLPFRNFGVQHHAGMEGTAAAERIFAVLDQEVVERVQGPGTVSRERPLTVEFDDVRVIYPGAETAALDGVSFSLAPGKLTALVGPSGAGKTTVVRLLMGFVGAQSGAVIAGGTDLGGVDPETWRRHVAFVPQNPHIFDGTVLENMLLARPEATRREVREALESAEAWDFVEGLPDGLETALGESAGRLSGGERQRLAVARAFLKDAQILVMDEPSSNLDPLSEQRLVVAMRRLIAGRTALIVAHRLSTVFEAEQIVVLEQGRVVEHGTHDSLVEQKGVYAAMIAAQAGGQHAPESKGAA